MKILLSGGGTLGPVTPLLGLVEYWRAQNEPVDLVWVGTVHGPEASLVTSQDIRFISIASVKMPRYVSFYWVTVPFRLVYAFVEAWNVLKIEQPDVIVTAGGYVSVPLVVLGRLKGIRSWVHQQDLLPGLANKIMARFATKISVTFDASKDAFSAHKTEVTGNAVRASMLQGSRERALLKFGLRADRKTLLVLGGGSGATW
ncbi:TPA: UDP-N-acetylglucosamine--N-acetylmuramyl-(pentapeptide) pyrophosphoryl-undecaprenol N-acetylglucosamine transferase, partial [Candidatus Uhrbacteria bacterium]|nr:UDP-N-acetylglucosamine--N-acetylmuramyl-(pentapeptide) pyrophosphoryl-undecaprenol N-acetylglucosamine transferase [Candidatus Uhrbacteria bacterium]